jgi:1-acyl-sn-glycerol-3-phosphate acyltransferase
VARSPVHEKGNGWIKACEIALFPLTRLLGRRRYLGAEHLRVRGPVLVVANHISHLDPVFDTVFIRTSGRIPHVLAKASLWKLPLIGRVMAGTEQIPVDRGGGAGQAALEKATAALADGKVVLIYPEGTVTKDPQLWPMRPRPGVAALALAGDFPVIPVAHWGSHEVYRSYGSGRRFKPLPRKDVFVVAGDPIDLSAFRGRPVDNRAIRDVSYLIMGRIRDMVGELRGEQPPADFYDPKAAARRAGSDTGSGSPRGGASGTAGDGTSAAPAPGSAADPVTGPGGGQQE